MNTLKERPVNYHYMASETVSEPPSFDVEAAQSAYQNATTLVSEITTLDMPTIRSGIALMLFNRGLEDTTDLPAIKTSVARLIREESVAQNPNNPLPTIGFEVEIPTKHAMKQSGNRNLQYAALSDAFGFPQNFNNDDKIILGIKRATLPSYWELAPHYSYTSAPQKMVISELVRSRIVPRLRSEYIAKKLSSIHHPAIAREVFGRISSQGLALHINIGVPTDVVQTHEYVSDYRKLGAACAIAFSSQMRLDVWEIGEKIVKSNTAEPSVKTDSKNSSRLEFRAFEVLDRTSVKAIDALHLLSAAMFEAHKAGIQNEMLTNIWSNFTDQLLDIFPEDLHDFDPYLLGDTLTERESVAEIASKYPEIKPALQDLILRTQRNIKEHLQKEGWI